MITRYDHVEEDVMEVRTDGEWIRFSDHEAESKDLKDLILVLRGFRPVFISQRCKCGWTSIGPARSDITAISGRDYVGPASLCPRCRAPLKPRPEDLASIAP